MTDIVVEKNRVNARKVWTMLDNAVTGVSIQELSKQLALSFGEVIDAVRWLARDFNIGLANDNGQLVVIGV